MQKLQVCAAALALWACVSDSDEANSEARRRKDAGTTPTPTPTPSIDASTTPTPSDPAGSVSCYTEGAPSNTCALPVHCCFSNYSSQLNGECTTSACSWGTIDCDGPEDCAAGDQCCATKLEWGYKLACQSSACGAPPSGEELCHASATCGDARSCVSASGVNYSLPRTLAVCR